MKAARSVLIFLWTKARRNPDGTLLTSIAVGCAIASFVLSRMGL